jgi:hypothetical protein
MTGAARAMLGGWLAACAVLAGCGGTDEEPPPAPSTPFAQALATLGGGGEGASLGVGWVDGHALRAGGGGDLGQALGPNASSVVEVAPALRRRFGLDPLAARTLVSVGGSYAFGLRLDGVPAGRLPQALIAAGGRERQAGDGVRYVGVDGYASVPPPLLELGVRGLGARDAFSADRVVLAISGRARDSLLGVGGRLIDQPQYVAAAECVGDAVAARLVPAKLLQSTELGVDLVAAALRPHGAEEVLCVFAGDAGRADADAAALERGLALRARDPVTRRRIGEELKSVRVERRTYGTVEAVRVEIERRPASPRGYVLRDVANGALARYLVAAAP